MGSPTIFSGKYTKLLTQKGLLQQGGAVNQFDGPRNYIANSSLESGTLDGWNRVKTTITSNLPSGTPTIGKLLSVAPSISSFSAFSGTAPFDTYGLRFGNVLSTVVAGEGIISDAFTIEPGDRGKVLTFKLYYQSDLGASTDNWSGILGSQTWAVYIYDQTAGAWLQPAGFLGMNQNSGVGIVSGTFQSSVVSGQQYRIAVIALRNTTSTSALQIDNIYVGSQTAPIGPVVTDWVSYTPTGSWTSNVTYTGQWRRVGDSMEINAQVVCSGAPNAANLTFNLPSGYSIDIAKLPSNAEWLLGHGTINDVGVQGYDAFALYNNQTSFRALFKFSNLTQVTYGSAQISNTAPFTFGNTDTVAFNVKVPISGWSSQVQLSNDTDTRVVAAYILKNSLAPQASNTPYNFGASAVDTHGAWNGTTTYTIPVSGWYRISAQLQFNITASAGQYFNLAIAVNGTSGDYQTKRANGSAMVSDSFPLMPVVRYYTAGQQITIVNTGTNYSSVTASVDPSWISIERLSGPSVVAANETVVCHVETSAAPTLATGIGSAISFPTKVYDTHNAFSGNTYTVPVSGKYRITALLTIALSPGTGAIFSDIYVNGVLNKNLTALYPYLANGNNHRINGSVTIQLTAGQTVQLYGGTVNAVALYPSGIYNYFIIERVGN